VAAVASAIVIIPLGIRNTEGSFRVDMLLVLTLFLPPEPAGVGSIGSALRAARAPHDEFADTRPTT